MKWTKIFTHSRLPRDYSKPSTYINIVAPLEPKKMKIKKKK